MADGINFATTFVENGGSVAAVAADMTVSDPDSDNLVGATVRITNPLDGGMTETLSVMDDVFNGITAQYNATTATLTLTADTGASLEDFQTLLRSLTYDNASENPSTQSRVIEVTVTDGERTSAVATSTISIVAVDDLTDLEDPGMATVSFDQELTVTLTATDLDAEEIVFQIDDNSPMTDAFISPALVTVVDGVATATFTWTPTAEDGVGEFTFVILAVGNASSDSEPLTVTVVNETPVVDLNGMDAGLDTAETFTEDGGPVSIVEADATVTHPSGGMIQAADIVIVNALDGTDEVLNIDGSGLTDNITIVQDLVDKTRLTMVGEDTAENYQALIRLLTYDNLSDDPDVSAERVVEISVNDGTVGSGGNQSRTAVSLVTVVAVDDAPMLTLPANTTTAINGQPLAEFIATATDPDTPAEDLVFSLDLTNSGITGDMPTISSPSNLAVSTFAVPVGTTDPGPLPPGESYSVTFSAKPGDSLSFATMVVQTNDWFLAPGEDGIALFDVDDNPVTGNVTAEVQIWDAGTEADQTFGMGADQAPRQSGPNTGAVDPDNTVREVTMLDGNALAIGDFAEINLLHDGSQFTLEIRNISAGALETPLAPGVAVVHNMPAPLFTVGEPDRGEGLEALAEDGDNAALAAALPGNANLGGLLSWTPSSAGMFEIVVIVTDPEGNMDMQTLTVDVADSSLASTSQDNGYEDPTDRAFADLGGDADDEEATDGDRWSDPFDVIFD